jgi:lipopolysaccharide/colanic/teichoic acid biosynthesis glycosyltransferase
VTSSSERLVAAGPGVKAACRPAPLADAVRRTFSFVVALLLLVVTLPLLIVVVIAIRVESPGSPIFRQRRVGRGCREFTMYKFRGMFIDACERWPELYCYDYQPDEAENLFFHFSSDPRVTRVGRFIRSTSIDELPNLINVLKGDMLLVGPRPETPELLPYWGGAAAEVFAVTPGITSPAKAHGRDDLSLRQTIELELDYVRNRSLLLDARVLLATIPAVLLGRGNADRPR